MKVSIIPLLFFVFISCNNDNINDKSKRNENWLWRENPKTGKGEWVHLGGTNSNLKDGKYTNFYFNGVKCEEWKRVNGKIVDTIFSYDLKGQLDYYELNNGLDSIVYIIHNGYRKVYNKDGSLLAESNIKNHTYYGVLINYYKNGNKRFVRNYVKDSGWSVNYYENGQMKDSAIEFNNTGKGENIKEWYENGQVKLIIGWNIKSGIQSGITKVYNKKVVNTKSSDLKKEFLDGTTLMYYQNGQLKDSCFYIKGKHEGIAKHWHENGQLEILDLYKHDSLISSLTYDEKGNPE